jgi:aquaporin Z
MDVSPPDKQAGPRREAKELELQQGISQQEQQSSQHVPMWRKLLAELLGTFALTLVAAGADVISTISHGEVDFISRMVAPGMLVTVMIYTVGNVSGAHFNPVVTLAFALRRDFRWRRVPAYWLVQFIGALLAALLLRTLFGLTDHLGATLPHYSQLAALVMEIVLTFLLITVILATATNEMLVGHNAALAVGATIALDGLFAGPISGASMNPARSLGPMLIAGDVSTAWLYLVGPVAGALLAVLVAWLLRGPTTPQAVKTASGE